MRDTTSSSPATASAAQSQLCVASALEFHAHWSVVRHLLAGPLTVAALCCPPRQVLALIMRDDGELPRARAISFAPPPCVSSRIAEEANDTVVSVVSSARSINSASGRRQFAVPLLTRLSSLLRRPQVNGADIVPRLSVSTLLPYFATCRYLSSLNSAKKRLIDVGMHRAAVDWELLIEMSKREKTDVLASERLYVPGLVLQMVKPKEVRQLDAAQLYLYDTGVDVVRVPRTDFVHVRREKGMFWMHAPHRYRQSLVGALKSLGGKSLRRTADSGGLLRSLLLLPTSRVPEEAPEQSGASLNVEEGRPGELEARTVEFSGQ
jgi:hypothetical protein